ncbi:MAG: transglutaminase domain-containing protein, partial [Planctomycetes bacterium]|nr:transglutaminase domain-containing protein [Planctomycetota bacterium]
MRLFYDERSTRPRAEALLVACDVLGVVTAVLFATGALHGRGGAGDAACLAAWASIPRASAVLLGLAGRPAQGLRVLGGSLALLLVTILLVVAGLDLLTAAGPRPGGPEAPTVLVIFLLWGSGFLLFHPRASRLHDFLLWAVVLLGLKDGQPRPLLWVPAVFACYFTSAASRHLLHDVFGAVSHPRINLQNARAAAALAASASALVLAATYDGLGLLVGEPAVDIEPDRGKARIAASFADGDPGAQSPAAAGEALKAAAGAASRDGGAFQVVGFTYKVALGDLSLAAFDPREVLRLRPAEVDAAARAWRPGAGTRWKAVTLTTFEPLLESWSEESRYVRQPWPPGGVLPRRRPPPVAPAPAVLLEARVVTPVARNVVLPYFAAEVRSREFTLYRENEAGDVFPYPPPARDARYGILFEPHGAGDVPAGHAAGAHEDRRYRQVPPEDELGIDLQAHARGLFAGAGEDIGAKIARLEEDVSKRFRYSNHALWRPGKSRLSAFLLKERVGNCTYFATAGALLLRAAGVSTRLAVGFHGGEWDAASGEVIVRNGTAHAWVEVYFPGGGWYPIDPTSWAPPDPSYRPPPEARKAAADLRRLLASQGTRRDDRRPPVPSLPELPPDDALRPTVEEWDQSFPEAPEDVALEEEP